MKVLLLEDEYMLSRSIGTYLLNQNYFVDIYDNGKDVLEVIETTKHDFYILDINTPLVGGLECLKVIAKKYPQIPKIIISAYHDISHISDAYEFGCSDYLKKPFNLKELEIRMHRLLPNNREPVQFKISSVIKLGTDYSFDKETNLLYYKGEVQRFTKKEHDLLLLFISNLGQIISDENIRSFIWKEGYTKDSTIRSLIKRLNSKLKEELIQNIRGFGYLMAKPTPFATNLQH